MVANSWQQSCAVGSVYCEALICGTVYWNVLKSSIFSTMLSFIRNSLKQILAGLCPWEYEIRACSLYSTVDESSDVLKSCPTRKKTDFSAFFYFFLRHARKVADFFYPVGRFSVKNTRNMSERKKNTDLSFNFSFVFISDKALKPHVGIRRI